MLGVIRFDAGVGVPLAAGAVVELHETDAALDEPPREQAVAAKDGGFALVHAVETAGLLGFAGDIHRLGGMGLHAERQLVAGNAGIEFGLLGPRQLVLAVE